jgi:hypothetical protein
MTCNTYERKEIHTKILSETPKKESTSGELGVHVEIILICTSEI